MYGTTNSVITLAGQRLELANRLGINLPLNSEELATTINSKHGIVNYVPNQEDIDKRAIRYFGIGINGSYAATAQLEGGHIIDTLMAYQPSEKNLDLYYPIPVTVIPVTDYENNKQDYDELYYLRSEPFIGIDGNSYYKFWLKRCEVVNDSIETFTVTDGDTYTAYDLYTSASSYLNPTPEDFTESTPITVVTAKVKCVITGVELAPVIDHLLGGNKQAGIISEIGIYAGADISIVNNSTTYTDAAMVQLAVHRCVMGRDLSEPQTVIEELFSFENGGSIIARRV